ncbi:MAG: beta-ketoacyl synthase N-terminal-like domain-containing protein [Mariprofundaceae bacterium]|nr:beta-ketoacyl synthase N-terminal-like domain-containing protein [Mariprofundaceae bacterium]
MNSSGENHTAEQAKFTPLAIIGMGSIFPQAENVTQFWHNVRDGVDAIIDIPDTHWDTNSLYNPDPKAPDQVYGKKGGFLPPVDFEPMKYGVLPNALEAIDTSQLLGLVAVEAALKDAGYGEETEFNREQVSVILGVTGALELVIPLGARLGHPRWRKALEDAGVDHATAEDVIARIADGYTAWQENSFPGLLGNVVAGRISKHFNFGGTNCVVDAACGSSLSALNLAALELAAGRSDMVITGGVDTFNDVFMYSCFSKTPALSPSGHACSFDADADGTTLGEGIGIVVIKRLTDAERDGDRIYAVIKGLGTSSDGRDSAIYEPDATGQQKAVRRAYTQASIDPKSIGLIEAHGTGTRVGDGVEVAALQQVFGGAERPWCALGSVKSQIGHTKAAAGIAGLIKSTLALHHKVLPPSIKVNRPRAEITAKSSAFFINTESRPWLHNGDELRRAGVSALGFGGSNYHCLLEEYQTHKQANDWVDYVQWFALSSPSREALYETLSAMPIHDDCLALRRQAAATRQGFDAAAPCRLTWVVEQQKTDQYAQRQHGLRQLQHDEATWQTPDGMFFSSGECCQPIALLFPGQSTPYPHMLHELALCFPSFFNALAEADQHCGNVDGKPLSEYIYPRSCFDQESKKADIQALHETTVAQPALGAIGMAAHALLSSFGVQADAYAGHSYGELPALCAAGVFDTKSLYHLSNVRGELMAAAGEANDGAMLAIFAPLTNIENMIDEQHWDVVLANRNMPNQGVISGNNAAIEHAMCHLETKGVDCKKLDVNVAFHSRFVGEAVAPLASHLQDMVWQKPTTSVYANTTGNLYPEDCHASQQLLAQQLVNPVVFVDEIETMYAAGIRIFIEVGPKNHLSAMVQAILGKNPHQTIAMDASQGRRSAVYDFACVLARLSVLGHTVNTAAWDVDVPRELQDTKPSLRIPLCGANPFTPKKVHPPKPKKSLISEVAVNKKSTTPPPTTIIDHHVLGKGIDALQSIQTQTARLHEQFLHGQEEATRALLQLLEQQVTPNIDQSVETPVLQEAIPQTPVLQELIPQAPVLQEPILQAPVLQEPIPQAPAALNTRAIRSTLLDTVAEKTGYPVDMLDDSMTLDGDLGIDSIKRVEILAALQSALPNAPVITPEDLGVLRTLGQIIAHLAGSGTTTPSPTVTAKAEPSTNIAEVLLNVVAEKTGYPVDMLDDSMTLDTDLGIDSIKRVEILAALQVALPDSPKITPTLLGELRTLADIIDFLSNNTPDATLEETIAELATESLIDTKTQVVEASLIRQCVTLTPWNDDGQGQIIVPADALCWLTDDGDSFSKELAEAFQRAGYQVVIIDPESPPEIPEYLHILVLLTPESGINDAQVWHNIALLQQAETVLRCTEASRFITVSRLNGQCGFAGDQHENIANPQSGGLAGLLKTAHLEWPEVRCMAVDIARNLGAGDLVRAALCDHPPLELGIGKHGIVIPTLHDTPLPDQQGELPVAAGDLVVVSGGARGVTAHVAIALAKETSATLLLLGRTAFPENEPAWLLNARSESEIKHALMANADTPHHPRELNAAYQKVKAGREIRATMEAIDLAGGRALYRAVDITHADDVAWLIGEVRAQFGGVKGIIHGAGVLADRLIGDKTHEQFSQVYNTKVAGLRSLLAATNNDPVCFMVLFSSSTARFGRVGQVDYAIANEILNKEAQAQAMLRPDCRVIAPNWGPWDGGMVTPALKDIFAGEGIDVIDLDAGASYLINELRSTQDGAVEMVILGAHDCPPAKVACGQQTDKQSLESAFELTLSLDNYPFLSSHVMNHQAVLPMAMMIEWMAHAAIHQNPGLLFHGFEGLRVLKAITIQHAEQRVLSMVTGAVQCHQGQYTVAVEIHAIDAHKEHTIHAHATLLLVDQQPAAPIAEPLPNLKQWPHPMQTIYQDERLFHGPDLHALVEISGYADDAIHARVLTAPSPDQWIEHPMRQSWLADPLALDGSFQMMILWAFERHGMGSLPVFAGHYRQYVEGFPDNGVDVRIRISEESTAQVEAVIEFIDPATGKLLARMEDYTCVMDASLAKSFQATAMQR